MQYHEIAFRVDDATAEALIDGLACHGFHAFACASRVDGGQDVQLWADDDGLPAAVQGLCAELGIALPAAVAHDEATLLACGQDERPFALCQGVWVQPGPTREGIPAGTTVLRIPPGPAFGDGRHPSTRMAADLLPADCRGLRVYDCGCGSGVLAVLAALRGAQVVDASDIDPGSVRACAAMAAQHAVPVRVFPSDLIAAVPDGAVYDCFVANLYADLLLELLPDQRFRQLLPAGTFICSGVAQERRARVERAMAAAGLTIVECREEAWWCALRATCSVDRP